MQNFYMTVTPWDSQASLPENSAFEFTTLLSSALSLQGVWYCGLSDSYLEGLGIEYTHVQICSDIVHERVTSAQRLPILRETFLREQRDFKTYNPIQYVELNSGQISKIRCFVNGRRKKDIREARFTLHFVPLSERDLL